MIVKEKKQELISSFQKKASDTGSTEVQVALLTESIDQLNKHLKNFPKDKSSKLGLIKMVGKRNRLLKYLNKKNHGNYLEITKKLGLRQHYTN